MSEVIARHKRSYGREEMIFDPLHYLSLLEQKANALDQAAPLAGWQLPEGFSELRRQMEGRLGKRGRREYVQVLRLLETFSLAEVTAAVGQLAGDFLRCRQTSGAVRPRTETTKTGSGELSTSAGGRGGADPGGRLPSAAAGGPLTDTPQVLLEHYLKQLRMPTMVREYRKLGEQCAKEGATFEVFLLRLVESEMVDRERRATERRIKAAKFPVSKSLETYNFLDMPTLNKKLVVELARCEWIGRRENVLALGNSGTGKTHISLALGLAACQQGFRVRFTTAAALVHELIEARDEKRLLRYQKQLTRQELLIVDELGFVPLSKTGAEMLFEVLSQRYEQSSTLVTSNLPFAEWTEVLGSERLTGALLDRLTHHVHILEMNGESYRLKNSKKKKDAAPS
jgi:DNA replication protein DnaC